MDKLRVAVVGASGYTGAELIRILLAHPRVELAGLYAYKSAGEPLSSVFPQFAGRIEEKLGAFSAAEVAAKAQAAFLALPHGESAQAAKELLARGVTVFDLSADFRLRDPAEHAEWYGAHHAPELLSEARYGLVERHRAALREARLVAVPGCYPTATLLALAPLVERKLIASDGIVVDAKSGVSGAGRAATQSSLFCEAGEGVRGYKIAEHRHTPEIEQELARAAGSPIRITFTPHLIPMSRGILSTCYGTPTDEKRTRANYLAALREAYAGEPFVSVVERAPDTAHVRGSNRAHVSVFVDARARRVIAVGAIDNLVKGASGQAVQCLNVRFGLPETDGLDGVGLFP
jgi:N-acetyl-gamma-glutamyl-phosphate reductase